MAIAPSLSFARDRVNSSLTDLCTIARGGVALPYTMPDGSQLRCSASTGTTRVHLQGTATGTFVQEWEVTLPDQSAGGVPIVINKGDVITIGTGASAGVYTALSSTSSGTYSVSTSVAAFKAPLGDDTLGDLSSGPRSTYVNGAHIAPDNTPVAIAARQVVLDPPSATALAIKAQGGSLMREMLDTPDAPWVQGDSVTILDDNKNPTDEVYQVLTTFTTGTALAVILVANQ